MIIEDHQPQTTMIFQTGTKNTPSKNSFHYGCRQTWKNIGINRFKTSCSFNVWNSTSSEIQVGTEKKTDELLIYLKNSLISIHH